MRCVNAGLIFHAEHFLQLTIDIPTDFHADNEISVSLIHRKYLKHGIVP